MPTKANAADLHKRHKTRHPGVYYRIRADGKTKSYTVSFNGRFVAAGTTEKEAVTKQADLRGKKARGERVVIPKKGHLRRRGGGVVLGQDRARAALDTRRATAAHSTSSCFPGSPAGSSQLSTPTPSRR